MAERLPVAEIARRAAVGRPAVWRWAAHSSEGDRPFQAKATTCSS